MIAEVASNSVMLMTEWEAGSVALARKKCCDTKKSKVWFRSLRFALGWCPKVQRGTVRST